MKLAITTHAYPALDMPAIIDRTRQLGFEGLELSVAKGTAGLAGSRGWLADPEKARHQVEAAGLEFVCLATAAGLDQRDSESLSQSMAVVRDSLDLARQLACPSVRIYASSVRGPEGGSLCRERRETTLVRVSRAVRSLVPHAVKQGVAVLVENGGEFADSASVWNILEAIGSPMVKCSWNPSAARKVPERCTTAIPRLGSKIALVRVSVGGLPEASDPAHGSVACAGDVDVPRLIQLLKGINYQGHLVVDWPGELHQFQLVSSTALGPASLGWEATLSAASTYLRKLLDEKPVVLTAYKGDKFRPRQGLEFAVGR